MKSVEKYKWPRSAEGKVMQEALRYDPLYTQLSASIVISENGVRRMGQDPDAADDRRKSQSSTSSFIGFGAQYANPVVSGNSCPSPRRQNSSSRPNRQIALRQQNDMPFDVPHQFRSKNQI